MLMQRGPKATDDVNQSANKITIAVPEDVAVEISWRVKARRVKDPAYSRNDFFRAMILDHFKRHPFKVPNENGTS